MQLAYFLEKSGAERLCQHILGLDSAVLFAGICNIGGGEIASASKRSVPIMIGTSPELREAFSSGTTAAVTLFRSAEPLLGELRDIVASFKNLKVMIISLGQENNAAAVLVTTRELDSKNIAYQISRVTRNYAGS